MKYYDNYTRIIALKEITSGNETVGDMWIETKSFPKSTPVHEIIDWARNCSGKLIITIDENEASEDS